MTDRSGIFAGDDPFAIARAWLAEAEASEPNDPNAIALSTVDADGLPNARMVLLKEIEAAGFVFYTNYDSAKGREIAASGKAAFVMHWKSLRRQIRVRGLTSREDGPQADSLFRLAQSQKPAGGLGLAAIGAACVAHGIACRGGEGHGAAWNRAEPAALLGGNQNTTAGNGVLGRRHLQVARSLPMDAVKPLMRRGKLTD